MATRRGFLRLLAGLPLLALLPGGKTKPPLPAEIFMLRDSDGLGHDKGGN